MAYVISDSCVSCGTCESECPVSAISQGDSQYVIDADACISCGTCAGVCPTGAISEGELKHKPSNAPSVFAVQKGHFLYERKLRPIIQ